MTPADALLDALEDLAALIDEQGNDALPDEDEPEMDEDDSGQEELF